MPDDKSKHREHKIDALRENDMEKHNHRPSSRAALTALT